MYLFLHQPYNLNLHKQLPYLKLFRVRFLFFSKLSVQIINMQKLEPTYIRHVMHK